MFLKAILFYCFNKYCIIAVLSSLVYNLINLILKVHMKKKHIFIFLLTLNILQVFSQTLDLEVNQASIIVQDNSPWICLYETPLYSDAQMLIPESTLPKETSGILLSEIMGKYVEDKSVPYARIKSGDVEGFINIENLLFKGFSFENNIAGIKYNPERGPGKDILLHQILVVNVDGVFFEFPLSRRENDHFITHSNLNFEWKDVNGDDQKELALLSDVSKTPLAGCHCGLESFKSQQWFQNHEKVFRKTLDCVWPHFSAYGGDPSSPEIQVKPIEVIKDNELVERIEFVCSEYQETDLPYITLNQNVLNQYNLNQKIYDQSSIAFPARVVSEESFILFAKPELEDSIFTVDANTSFLLIDVNEVKDQLLFRIEDYEGRRGWGKSVPVKISLQKKAACDYYWPILGNAGYITSHFGIAPHPIRRCYYFHKGLSMAFKRGTPIVAFMEGKVLVSKFSANDGNFLLIEHPKGLKTRYSHLDSSSVSVGDIVKAGQIIGVLGNTGLSTGPHLKFEMWYKDSIIDPLSYFHSRFLFGNILDESVILRYLKNTTVTDFSIPNMGQGINLMKLRSLKLTSSQLKHISDELENKEGFLSFAEVYSLLGNPQRMNVRGIWSYNGSLYNALAEKYDEVLDSIHSLEYTIIDENDRYHWLIVEIAGGNVYDYELKSQQPVDEPVGSL